MQKIIKKALCLMLCFSFMFISVPSAYASGAKTYDISQLKMKIDLPDDWTTFVQGSDNEAINLIMSQGVNNSSVNVALNSCVYLISSAGNSSSGFFVFASNGLVVSNIKTDITDFKERTDFELNKYFEAFKKYWDEKEVMLLGHSIYRNPQAAFITADVSNTWRGQAYYARLYYTIVKNRVIGFMLGSLNALPDDLKFAGQKAVDSIKFDGSPASVTDIFFIVVICVIGVALILFVISIIRRKLSDI